MPVTDDQVATLRANLVGDFEDFELRWERLDKEEAKAGYTALVAAGFFEAVDRRFAAEGTVADVIEFVGDVRSRAAQLGEELDPSVAERLIRHSLGDGSIADIDDATRGRTQMILLAALIVDEQLDEVELDEFLEKARALGDRLLS